MSKIRIVFLSNINKQQNKIKKYESDNIEILAINYSFNNLYYIEKYKTNIIIFDDEILKNNSIYSKLKKSKPNAIFFVYTASDKDYAITKKFIELNFVKENIINQNISLETLIKIVVKKFQHSLKPSN